MLATLQIALQQHSASAELCTVCLVAVTPHPDRAELEIALAGHPAPIIVAADGRVRHVGVHGTLLGLPGEVRPGLASATLAADETMILYTDGVTEAGRPNRSLGDDGLAEAARNARAVTLARLLEHIERVALDRSAGTPRDDLALLALRLSRP
jgi:serine phosphatase RsbU (regulator of sigma subunit)